MTVDRPDSVLSSSPPEALSVSLQRLPAGPEARPPSEKAGCGPGGSSPPQPASAAKVARTVASTWVHFICNLLVGCERYDRSSPASVMPSAFGETRPFAASRPTRSSRCTRRRRRSRADVVVERPQTGVLVVTSRDGLRDDEIDRRRSAGYETRR